MVEFVQIDKTDELVEALEANLFSYFTNFGRAPFGERHENANLLYFATNTGSMFHSGVFRARLPPEEIQGEIAKIIEYFAAKQAPFCWWTSQSTQPADLGQYLESQGLKYWGEMSGMAIDLSNLSSSPCPDNLEIIRVENRVALESWLLIAVVGFDFPAGAVETLLPLEESLGLQSDQYIRYFALWRGFPVAISTLYLDAGVAGIYLVSTLPEARGKGFATQVVQTALADAQKLGYRVAILQSTASGKRVYQRIGFQECCPMAIHFWQPPL